MLGMTSGADWLIAGLGNPEPKYDGTRHNAGFEALDYLAAQWGAASQKPKWQGPVRHRPGRGSTRSCCSNR